MRWKLGFSRPSDEYEAVPRQVTSWLGAPEEPVRPAAHLAHPLSHLDEMGQRGELMRVRVNQLAERLEEVKSLPADFAAILDPLSAITAELPKARVRNAELEGLLAREREVVGELRRQVGDLTGKANGTATDLSGVRTDLQRAEAALRDREAELQETRGKLAERSQVADDLDRQLGAETERARDFAGENKAMRAEVQVLDQAVTRASRDLAETRERLALSEQEAGRLQTLGEEQATRIAELTARVDALVEDSAASRERLQTAEARLAAEVTTRERTEAQAQVELGMARSEAGNLTLRLEAASSRAAALDRLVEQIRGQLRQREEAVRSAERAAKEVETERLSHERRLEAAQAELARAGERSSEAQHVRAELEGRCDMLIKALAAKDAALEQALSRAATLTDQAEQLARRGEAERAEMEAAIRRLTEDLQNERSERALARGALEIARESRAALQRQYEALRRSGRVAEASSDPAGDPSSNIRTFPPQDRN